MTRALAWEVTAMPMPMVAAHKAQPTRACARMMAGFLMCMGELLRARPTCTAHASPLVRKPLWTRSSSLPECICASEDACATGESGETPALQRQGRLRDLQEGRIAPAQAGGVRYRRRQAACATLER